MTWVKQVTRRVKTASRTWRSGVASRGSKAMAPVPTRTMRFPIHKQAKMRGIVEQLQVAPFQEQGRSPGSAYTITPLRHEALVGFASPRAAPTQIENSPVTGPGLANCAGWRVGIQCKFRDYVDILSHCGEHGCVRGLAPAARFESYHGRRRGRPVPKKRERSSVGWPDSHDRCRRSVG